MTTCVIFQGDLGTAGYWNIFDFHVIRRRALSVHDSKSENRRRRSDLRRFRAIPHRHDLQSEPVQVRIRRLISHE